MGKPKVATPVKTIAKASVRAKTRAGTSHRKVAKKASKVAAQRKEQKSLKAVEKLLKNPIIDPRTEKAYKAAAISVQKSKRRSVAKLQGVEAILIATKRVNKAQASKAAVLANAASDSARDAAGAMERAAKARAGCVDSHAGICLGVKVQGHCGIKDYAKACQLSCHICSKKRGFIMGSPREKRHKREVEKAGKE